MNKGPTKAELVAAIRELLDLYINDGAGVEGVIPFEELLLRYEQSVGNVKEAKRLQRSILFQGYDGGISGQDRAGIRRASVNDQSTPEQIEMTKLLTETQYINVAATTATAPPVTVHYRDGTKREFHMIDGSLILGQSI